MRYICLVYHSDDALGTLTDEELDAFMAECGLWIAELKSAGHYVFSAALQSGRMAASVRTPSGRCLVTDGPHAETKELLGGFTIIEARDLNEAIHLASKLPAARIGRIEVRPVLVPGADMADSLDRRIAASMIRTGHRCGLSDDEGTTSGDLVEQRTTIGGRT